MDTLEPGRYYQLGSKTFWLILLERTLPAFVLMILSFGILLFPEGEIFAGYLQIAGSFAIYVFLLAILILLASIAIAFLEYKTSRVMMDNHTFHIVRGILSKHEISIPYRRVQSVEIKQSFLFRILGLARIVISTTTDFDQVTHVVNDEFNDEVIRTLDYTLASLIEKTLTSRAEVERIEIKKALGEKV